MVRENLITGCLCSTPSTSVITIWRPFTEVTTPFTREVTSWPLSRATRSSMPVPTVGDWGRSRGTAWRCMFDPISARLASSCSRNGISAADTLMICMGETSIRCASLGEPCVYWSPIRISMRSSTNWFRLSSFALAWAMLNSSSLSADSQTMDSVASGPVASTTKGRTLIMVPLGRRLRAAIRFAPMATPSFTIMCPFSGFNTACETMRPRRSGESLDSSWHTSR